MSQVPLAPPPPTGGPLDSWLYLLWRRLTQAGQILWSSLQPGTSADVAAVVTDETGTGSLVFNTSPTLVTPSLGVASGTSFQGIIGNVTPAAGTFTTLTSTGNAALGDAEATDTHAIKGATTVLASSASAALTVTQTLTGNAFVVEDSASPDSTPFIIDNAGYMLHGYSAKLLAANGTPLTQFYGVSGLNNIGLFGFRSSDGAGPTFEFARSRSATIGTHTVVNNNDYIGKLSFAGSDGTNFIEGASIRAEVDGTPGTNDMPVRLLFNTTSDGASSATERMRITSAGVITLGGTSSTPALKVTPVASQARWIEVTGATSSGSPKLNTNAGSLELGSTGNTALTIDSTGAVFTGLTAATFANQVSVGNAGGTTNRFYMVHFRGATATPNNAMSFASSRGAEGVYTAVQNNDSLGEVIFGGANGSAWAFNKVAFTAYASENWTSTANGAHFAIWVTPVGTVSRQVAFTILNGGDTYLGGTVAAPALKVTPVASQARWVEVTGATSSTNPTIGVSGGILGITASVAITGVVSTSGYTVATLPAGTVGQRAYVTDALAPAYGVAVAGGGAVTVPVFYNGAAWICA